MATEKRPTYLKPVPGGTTATAATAEDAPTTTEEESTARGVTPPLNRGHSGMFITDVIAELGYASQERVDQVIAEARTAGRSPERLMVEEGAISAEQLSRATAERYGLDHIDLSVYHVDMAAANLLSVSTARRHQALPVGYVDRETLLLAMADPANVLALDDIQMATGLSCRVAVASEEDVDALIGRLNTLQSAVSEAIDESEEEEGLDEAELMELRESAEDARSSSSCTASSARRSPRVPPTSTSSPMRATCAFASASTGYCTRRHGSPGAWSPASSRE